ncbi:ethanolamine ammonia-lyase subunit EutC [Alteromonas lipolytica]|uniref:Ethanolamine ammonia-lyase small subunit n=1 Tax=Alteromonas lipolytica TaxID=1856405 RepID=A0A1E8FIE2_9ALTE|nr:ethanolamine ammonia-lyase subunit EutC [Alteromonas lipolytica]OFI35496.1 ethanolamine ammonia-lyase [Alteromonas lipolytica]GGF76752.1 ethanolamine ammonia-lyase light chain [Alteromonas lipolytica]
MSKEEQHLHTDSWQQLRQLTAARIGLGRAGTSLPTSELLKFQLAHAQAIDAVHSPLDREEILKQFAALQYHNTPLNPLCVHSEAQDRYVYLQRPDLGRKLNEASTYTLQQASDKEGYDLSVVIADGLSATAVMQQSVPFLTALLAELESSKPDWSLAPVTLVEQGRVAVGDDIAVALNAKMVVVLIGERPGLSSPDSLGVYLTWSPERGCDDARRNCISNVRPEGLAPDKAAKRCIHLLENARAKQLSGIGLKDRYGDDVLTDGTNDKVFLLTSKKN